MCGIVATWGDADVALTRAMMRQLVHRGPDDAGLFAMPGRGVLGHQRLAIVDPRGGRQPLRSDPLAAVVNGEIYNAPRLRRELGEGRFSTGSDSEVVLHLWEECGPDMVKHLHGMYSLALTDGEQLFAARDPIGIKPLYLADHQGATLISSEIKALPPATRRVRALPPGTAWSSRNGRSRFYELPDPEPATEDLESNAGRLRAALEKAVERRLMADVPVGAFLSGGLDSSAIAALLRQRVEELHTFSVGIPGSPDLAAARSVARHLGTIHHEHIIRPAEVERDLPAIIRSLESFDQDLVRSGVPTWYTARLASRHVKVVLTGEGADELFAGYHYYQDLDGGPETLRSELRRSVSELHGVNLQRVDRMTMAHSLEARVPFLDTDVVRLGLAIPVEQKLPRPDGPEKLVLRHAVSDLLPTEVVWRKKAQFDEGTGIIGILEELASGSVDDTARYSAERADAGLRSAEECLYHRVFERVYERPGLVASTVARWSERPAVAIG